MLIASARHKPDDLGLWNQHERADKLVKIPNRLISDSTDEIKRFADAGQCYVGCSWGKDSVVLAHLVSISCPMLPVIWVRMMGRDNPDCEIVRDTFISGHSINYMERIFIYDQCAHDEHWKAVDEEFGSRRITGIRADESGNRKLSVRFHGVSTQRSCRPLAFWTGEMIFAYLAQNNLPVNPAYAMLGGGRWPRKYLRTHGIGGETGTNRGRREWEKEYYQDVLNRIASGRISK